MGFGPGNRTLVCTLTCYILYCPWLTWHFFIFYSKILLYLLKYNKSDWLTLCFLLENGTALLLVLLDSWEPWTSDAWISFYPSLPLFSSPSREKRKIALYFPSSHTTLMKAKPPQSAKLSISRSNLMCHKMFQKDIILLLGVPVKFS